MVDECAFQGNKETYRHFHKPSIIQERTIIGRGLDRHDTEASAKYVGSALVSRSLMLEETDKAVNRLPMNKPPKMSTAVTSTSSMMKGKEKREVSGGGE
jgi:hypothetical protein